MTCEPFTCHLTPSHCLQLLYALRLPKLLQCRPSLPLLRQSTRSCVSLPSILSLPRGYLGKRKMDTASVSWNCLTLARKLRALQSSSTYMFSGNCFVLIPIHCHSAIVSPSQTGTTFNDSMTPLQAEAYEGHDRCASISNAYISRTNAPSQRSGEDCNCK